ncbi:Ig-like domain-containing protein, partial [Flavobacteriales bacterium]|nr:Ig-like domain-containing protein [Flavobacteriales bacterium]
MKKTLLFTLLLAISAYASAQVPLSLTTTTTTTNFDGGTLDNNINGSSLNTFPTGWGLAEQGTSSTVNGFYRAGSGGSTVGDSRSYGAFSTTERALGALSNGLFQAWIGFAFINNTGSNITSMNVSYRGEQWRSGGPNTLLDSLLFEYSLNASSTGDMNATWVRVSALDFLSPNPTAVGGTSNGNLTTSQANLSSVISAIVATSDTVYFRWRDINVAGINDGLAIDDFAMTVTTTSSPLPPTLSSTNPADNSTNVSLGTSSLTLTLDQNITSIAAGNVQLTNVTSASSITIPAANLSFSGATLTITGFILNPNTDYAVQVAPNMLVTANGGFIGIT